MGADNQIMLCGVDVAFDSDFAAELLDVSELGADRRSVDATSNAVTWGEYLYSCITRLVPFTMTIAFNPNQRWDQTIRKAAETITITWPIPGGYTTAAVWSFKGGATSFRVRGALEERMVATLVVMPTGEITITPGTPGTPVP